MRIGHNFVIGEEWNLNDVVLFITPHTIVITLIIVVFIRVEIVTFNSNNNDGFYGNFYPGNQHSFTKTTCNTQIFYILTAFTSPGSFISSSIPASLMKLFIDLESSSLNHQH